MRLKSIQFGQYSNSLQVSVVRVIDKLDGVPGDPNEYVEFLIKNVLLNLNYHLTEDEIKSLIKMLEASVAK